MTTRGFRDALEIGREMRYDIYDIFLEPPRPLVSRRRRLEVAERLDHKARSCSLSRLKKRTGRSTSF